VEALVLPARPREGGHAGDADGAAGSRRLTRGESDIEGQPAVSFHRPLDIDDPF
jgi:hypothetical protein